MRLVSAVRYDIKFQIRHGFYAAYALVTLFYMGVLINLPSPEKQWIAVFLIFSDASVLGSFFIGGIILLERRQHTLETLFVTPLRGWEYLCSKTVSLTVLALIVSAVLGVIAGLQRGAIFWFLLGVVLSSVFFILVGVAAAVRSTTLNDYFYRAILYTMVFFLPVLDYLEILENPLLALLPTSGSLILIDTLFLQHTVLELLGSTGLLILWCLIAWIWASRWLHRYVIQHMGAES